MRPPFLPSASVDRCGPCARPHAASPRVASGSMWPPTLSSAAVRAWSHPLPFSLTRRLTVPPSSVIRVRHHLHASPVIRLGRSTRSSKDPGSLPSSSRRMRMACGYRRSRRIRSIHWRLVEPRRRSTICPSQMVFGRSVPGDPLPPTQ